MGYKTILTVWDGLPDSRPALNAAIEMARREDGHLNVLCLGIAHIDAGFYYAGASPAMLADNAEAARVDAKKYEAEVTEILAKEDIKYTVQAMVAQTSGVSYIVGQVSRFNDLVFLPKPYGRGASDYMAMILEAVMFQGGAPVLVYPANATGLPGAKVVIGWNESSEALNAVKAALPVLRKSKSVDIAVVAPPRHDEDQADPGAALSTLLSRHGVPVGVSVLAQTMPKVSETLLQHAQDQAADMLVIGAYGHSRFRESIMGGATRDLLETATLPVFMAH